MLLPMGRTWEIRRRIDIADIDITCLFTAPTSCIARLRGNFKQILSGCGQARETLGLAPKPQETEGKRAARDGPPEGKHLLQQTEYVLWNLVGLGQHGGTGLLQDLGTGQLRGLGREVRIPYP